MKRQRSSRIAAGAAILLSLIAATLFMAIECRGRPPIYVGSTLIAGC